jgi:hypothetical protein
MMNDFDITAIEQEVLNAVKALNISKRVYVNRPKSAPQAQDYVVVNVKGGVRDQAAYGECLIYIYLFAKDVENMKNGKKLSVMYQKLRQGLPPSTDKLLLDTEPNILGDTPDDFGFHARIINIKTIIKV